MCSLKIGLHSYKLVYYQQRSKKKRKLSLNKLLKFIKINMAKMYDKKEKHIKFELKITPLTNVTFDHERQPYEKACHVIKKSKVYSEYDDTYYLEGKVSCVTKKYSYNSKTTIRFYYVYVDIKKVKKEIIDMRYPMLS